MGSFYDAYALTLVLEIGLGMALKWRSGRDSDLSLVHPSWQQSSHLAFVTATRIRAPRIRCWCLSVVVLCFVDPSGKCSGANPSELVRKSNTTILASRAFDPGFSPFADIQALVTRSRSLTILFVQRVLLDNILAWFKKAFNSLL